MGYAVREIRDADEWASLQQEWNEVLASSRSNTIFLTWEWLYEWWRSYGGGRSLRILLLREDDGRLAAIAPLMNDTIRTRPFGQFRAIRFVGDGTFDSDYLDLICRPGSEPEVVGAVLERLDTSTEWDVLVLNDIPTDSPNLGPIADECRRRGYRVSRTPVPCACTVLPATWDAFLPRLKPRFRTKVRSLLRAAGGEEGREPLEYCRSEADLDAWLETLFDLHTRRWRSIGQPGVFGDPRKREFYRRLGRRFLERGWLRFSRLRTDDRPVAMQFCFEYDNRTFLLQEGFDPDEVHRNAGHTLRALVFADNIRRGVAAYDFLGGVSEHKLLWGAAVKESVRLTIVRPTLRGRRYRLMTNGVERLKESVRRIAPAWAVRAGRKMLRRGGGP